MYQVFSLILILLLLSGCGNQQQQSIKVGVSPGPQATIMYAVKNAAQARGLNIQVIEYGNYQDLNPALQREEIDANCFQTNLPKKLPA